MKWLSALHLILLGIIFACVTPLHAQDKADVKEWKKEMSDADAALNKNQFLKAKEKLDLALGRAEKFPTNDARLSETLQKHASACLNIGETTGAELDLHRALAVDTARWGSNSLHTCAEMYMIGQCCVSANRNDEAEEYFVRAQNIAEKELGKYNPGVGLSILGRANAAMNDDRLADAEKYYTQAIKILESARTRVHNEMNRMPSLFVFRVDPHVVAMAYNDQALLFAKQKKFADAEAVTKHSLDLIELQDGKFSRNLCNGLDNLAKFYFEDGKLKEAKATARRALSIMNGMDPSTPVVQNALGVLAAVKEAENKGK